LPQVAVLVTAVPFNATLVLFGQTAALVRWLPTRVEARLALGRRTAG
jgi:hypothetical protein